MTNKKRNIINTKSNGSLAVTFGGFSDKGRKSENQDAFAAHQPSIGTRNVKGVVACIADGVSCSNNSQEASQTSVTTFINDYFSTSDIWSIKEAASKVLSSLNAWLYQHSQHASNRQNGLVTTFSSIIVKSNTAHILHAGDSRIYRLRVQQDLPQNLLQNLPKNLLHFDFECLTRDHIFVQKGGDSYLTRALGMDNHLEIDYKQVDVQEGDIFLLTTDGVHDSLPENTLSSALKEAVLPVQSSSLESIAKDLCNKAETAGSTDNLSCLIVKVDCLPVKDIDEVHRQLTDLAIPPVMEVGTKIDEFTIEKVLHSGTRSHVYVASNNQSKDSSLVVLKAPSINFADDPQYLEGFVREQWIGSRINHKSVMKVHPSDPIRNSQFLYHVCDLVEGVTLRQWMFDNPSPSFETVREITNEIITALRVFQRHNMVHRDLKPENIMIKTNHQEDDKSGPTASFTITIIDFGTVQVNGLTELQSIKEETPVGAVDYIAPEYLVTSSIHNQSQKGVHASDIFSLGVIVYEILTGELPYPEQTSQKSQHANFNHWQYKPANAVRKDVPTWLDLALKKAVHPYLDSRYQAMSEFLYDLSTPNNALLSKLESAPLIERSPVRFWQLFSLVLAVLLALQTVWFHS